MSEAYIHPHTVIIQTENKHAKKTEVRAQKRSAVPLALAQTRGGVRCDSRVSEQSAGESGDRGKEKGLNKKKQSREILRSERGVTALIYSYKCVWSQNGLI